MPPESPTYVVIFISQRTPGDNGYGAMAQRMVEGVAKFNGYLDSDSVRDETGLGITVSYWRSLDDIANWKADAEHQTAQRLGKEEWYQRIHLTVAKVEKDAHWTKP
ncbi:MAG: antibiotic biosynthesis monooxygenase [Rhodospirillales bacterium]|nr:MAG: antibiotic biosynthesis monooxygenase [Rhodospirillales bacterium]